MKRMSQATEIIGLIERGDLNADLSKQIKDVLATLQELAPPKGKVKGEVKLTLKFSVEGSSVEIEASIDHKVPKRQRGRSFYFLTPDAEISTEHPQQTSIFDKPRNANAAS